MPTEKESVTIKRERRLSTNPLGANMDNKKIDSSAAPDVTLVPVVCPDGVHCGECPQLQPYGDQKDLQAKCGLTGKDLMWHDYWIASECYQEPDNVKTS